jgi:hypothetical protein
MIIRITVALRSFLHGKKLHGTAFFVLVVIWTVGLLQFRNYGIGVDESYMRRHGAAVAKYILNKFYPAVLKNFKDVPNIENLPVLNESSQDRTHGTVFELPMTFFEVIFNLTSNSQHIYFYRHLNTYIFCSLGVVAVFYYLAWRFKSIFLALLGSIILFLSPRQFADSFYNSKDAVFMYSYTISVFLAIVFINKVNKKNAVIAGISCAYATSIRPVGLVIALLTLLILFIFKRKANNLNLFKFTVVYALTLLMAIYLFWPYLWENPIKRFIEVTFTLSNYSLIGNLEVLTDGKYLLAQNLPWYYILKWMLVTIPIPYLILMVFGIFRLTILMIKVTKKNDKVSNKFLADLIILSSVITPITLSIITKSTFYDGWRHSYYIYPLLVVIALRSWIDIFSFLKKFNYKISSTYLILTGIILINNAMWIINNRPFQNVYFNQFAGNDIRSNWEMDYWGLSNRAALEYVLQHSNNPIIHVVDGSFGTQLSKSVLIIEASQRERLKFVSRWDEADYLITNYKGVKPFIEDKYDDLFSLEYEKWVGKAKIFSIYKRKIS